MKPFDSKYIAVEAFRQSKRKPDFDNLVKICRREKPSRPTLFEFGASRQINEALTAGIEYDPNDPLTHLKKTADAYRLAGYDYVAMGGSGFGFPTNRKHDGIAKTYSQNDGVTIYDWESYEKYEWPDPESYDYSALEKIAPFLDGMKVVVMDPFGVLEIVIDLMGYENMCYALADEPELVKVMFDQVGSRLVKYHEICARYETVGAHLFGDDWGFNSQTSMSHKHMRQYVLPWHKKEAQAVHAAGKIAILHSCGQLGELMEDVIEDLRYDAKHSFEDNIQPIEEAYKQYGGRIALLGGVDVDFLCRSTPEEVYRRSVALLEATGGKGYALGSGNSIPDYVPMENYLAMQAAAVFA